MRCQDTLTIKQLSRGRIQLPQIQTVIKALALFETIELNWIEPLNLVVCRSEHFHTKKTFK